jgi:hypothetical protein
MKTHVKRSLKLSKKTVIHLQPTHAHSNIKGGAVNANTDSKRICDTTYTQALCSVVRACV